MARGPGKGKSNNLNGRPKGIPNKTTKEAKELLESILFGQMDNANEMFNKLRDEPAKFIDAYSKLLGYVLPKKTDITTEGEKIQIQLPSINIITKSGA